MAAASGTQDAALSIPPHLQETWEALRDHAGDFDFFQAVRLLHMLAPDARTLAGSTGPEREPVRFQTNNELAFPPAPIESLDLTASPPSMTVNFMGMTGPHGALPLCYTVLLAERAKAKDTAAAEFLDIFNHRLTALFYAAWERHRFDVSFERDASDRLSHYLFSLIGLATRGLQDRMAVPDHALLFYSGLLSLQSRSVVALESVIGDYFDVPVSIRDFVGSWQRLRPEDRTVIDDEDESAQLGVTAVAGDAIWDEQSTLRITLGPLTHARYLDFLPDGAAWKPLRSLVLFFCGPEVQVELQLTLRRTQVPRSELLPLGESTTRLGWVSWIKSRPEFDRDPSDTILQLI